MPYYTDFAVSPRKERHAGISEGDHFHENGLMVLYRHAGLKRGIPAHGLPHSIPACRSLRGNTVMRKIIISW